jgi:hypothetical protein
MSSNLSLPRRPSMVSVAQHLMAILSHKSDYPVSHPQLQQVLMAWFAEAVVS